MSNQKNTSPAFQSIPASKFKQHRTNWHEAISCAIQIDLRDYAHLLKFQTEYVLGKNNYRIDLLIIRKSGIQTIPKHLAHCFRSHNLFEIKGAGSSISTDSYYKTIGYAGLLISQTGQRNQYTAADITLTLISLHYPRKLMAHLQKKRNLTVEKFHDGIYYIYTETFFTQIIVMQELSPVENLYLRCLTDRMKNSTWVAQLAKDYKEHQNQEIYIKYMHQLTTATLNAKGEPPMVCEGLLNLFGTSSEEIIARTKKEEADYYLPQISYLKSLLEQNNIQFNLDSVTKSKH